MNEASARKCLEDFLSRPGEARKLSGKQRRRLAKRKIRDLLPAIPAALSEIKPTLGDISPQPAAAESRKEEVPYLNLKIINQIISHCINRMPFIYISTSYDSEDLYQELFAVALTTIRKKHDGRPLGQGSRLFIERRISGAIIDILRRELPCGGRGASAYAKYEQYLESGQPELATEQLAEFLGVTEQTAKHALKFGERQKMSQEEAMISLDEPAQDKEGAPFSLHEIIPDRKAKSPEQTAMINEQLDLVRSIIARLTPTQREALASVITEEPLVLVGKRLSLSESRIWQEKEKVLLALRQKMESVSLRERYQQASRWHR